MPLKAIVRVRIPLKRPEHEANEEGDEDKDNTKSDIGDKTMDQKDKSQPPTPRNNEKEGQVDEILEEQELEDKVTKIGTQGENYQIYVMH